MKFALAGSLIALAGVASAQLDNIPSCALSCFIPALGSDGCSSITDFKCHCQKGSELLSKVQPCVQGACSAADQQTTITAVQKTCADAGAPIVIPNAPGASSAAGAASSAVASVASSAAGAASSAAGAASSKVASATSAAASAASSAAGAASSLASKVSSALASATGNGTASAKPSSPVATFTGGAPQATKAAALVGAAAIALLAL